MTNKNWKIEDGDYRRDMHYRSTKKHIRGQRNKKLINRVILISIYAVIIAAAAYYFIVV